MVLRNWGISLWVSVPGLAIIFSILDRYNPSLLDDKELAQAKKVIWQEVERRSSI